jgi:hypothetical protein
MKNILAVALASVALLATPTFAQEVGVGLGTVDGNETTYAVRVQPFADAPLTFEGTFDAFDSTDLLGVNLVATKGLTDRLGVYALGGVGYRWDNRLTEDATWTYGAGATYELTESLGLDARARSVNSFENDRDVTLYTVGVNVSF